MGFIINISRFKNNNYYIYYKNTNIIIHIIHIIFCGKCGYINLNNNFIVDFFALIYYNKGRINGIVIFI